MLEEGAWIVFVGYLIVGLPIALDSILTQSANLVYFTEVDNWIGNYLLIVLGWCVKDRALDEMNRVGLWKVPKWFFRLFHQFLTHVTIITFVVFFTRDYWIAANLVMVTMKQLKSEINKIKNIKSTKKQKYTSQIDKIHN